MAFPISVQVYFSDVQFDLDYPATLGPAPIRMNHFSGYGSYAQTRLQ